MGCGTGSNLLFAQVRLLELIAVGAPLTWSGTGVVVGLIGVGVAAQSGARGGCRGITQRAMAGASSRRGRGGCWAGARPLRHKGSGRGGFGLIKMTVPPFSRTGRAGEVGHSAQA